MLGQIGISFNPVWLLIMLQIAAGEITCTDVDQTKTTCKNSSELIVYYWLYTNNNIIYINKKS